MSQKDKAIELLAIKVALIIAVVLTAVVGVGIVK